MILYFKKRFHEKQIRERYLTDTYDKLMISWLKKLEKKETNPTKKSKDIKLREYFEKQFPELRKQREDKERFSRVGQRIRSDAELEEIMDGLQEQELEDKKMRSYAVIPPILLDTRHKKHNFINRNGIIEDPMAEYKERQMLNIWTDQEKEIFREKYLQHPKNFGLIASFLERKSVSECVQYYYLSKKSENYKQLLRKHVKKRTRQLVKAQQQQQQQQQQALAAQQQRPSPTVTNRPQNADEVTKAAPIVNTSTSTSTTITTMSTTTTTTTALTSHTGVNVITTTTTSNTSSVMNIESNDSLNGPTSALKSDDSIINRNSLKCDNISDNEDMNETNESCDSLHKCCLCENKVENFSKSRPVTTSNINLYSISNNNLKPGMRVCLMCHFKNVRRQCPIASCKTPRRKVKRLKMLPQLWFEMSAERRQVYANELNISVDSKTGCPRCVMRVSRRIGVIAPSERNNVHQSNASPVSTSWSESEIELIKKCIKEHGKDWNTIAAQIRTKTVKECRNFYINYKFKLNLNQIVKEFMTNSGKPSKNGESDSDEYWNEMSEGDSEETSSAEEGNDRCNSDTASASSPINKNIEDIDVNPKSIREKSDNMSCSSTTNNFQEDFNKLQDYKGLSASQGSLKSDYDSSATMSADEGQGNCENERLSSSPAVNLPPRANSAMPVFPPSNSIFFQHQSVDKHVRPASHDAAFAVDIVNKTSHSSSVLRTSDSINVNARQKVPPFLINPNAPSTHQTSSVNSSMISNVNKEEPTCVRDLIYQAIEMSLQSPLKPMRNNNGPPIVSNDINKQESHDLINSSIYSLPIVKRENIVDMSKQHDSSSRESPSRLCFKNPDLQRPEGLAMMASYSQHLSSSPGHPSHPYVIVEPDNYEVQDLSKKDRRLDNYSPSRNFSPSSMKDKILLHRSEYPYGYIPPAHSNQNRGSTPVNEQNIETKDSYNSIKHSDSTRLINSGHVFPERIVCQQPEVMSQQSITSPSNRGLKMSITKGSPVPPPPPLITSGKPHQSYSQLSPKTYREKLVPVSAASGGSITQGTPGIPQQTGFPYGQTRYEGLLRQIPPVVHKESGSITLGTPVSGSTNFPIDPLRRKNDGIIIEGNRSEMLSQRPNMNLMYDPSAMEQYFRRASPTGHHSYSPGFQQQNAYQSSLHQMNKSPFHKESQLSSKQIMIDFNTSKQMLTRRGSNSSEKDARSSTPVHQQMELRDQKISSQSRINSYPNYAQNSGNSPQTAIQSSVYSDRIPHRESQTMIIPEKSQMIGPTEPHMSHWSARHQTIGSQSPNYVRIKL